MNLILAHEAFYQHPATKKMARFYDRYMTQKDEKKWTDTVPNSEVSKLFSFIKKWDPHFQGDQQEFEKIYQEISPTIRNLKPLKFENVDLEDDELVRKIDTVFKRVAECPGKRETVCARVCDDEIILETVEKVRRYESTDSSKILHTMLPHLIVMWERDIRKEILGSANRKWETVYTWEFLPKMQKELKQAIESCRREKNLSRQAAIKYIRDKCDDKTLPKLVDEYNYMVCKPNRRRQFREYIEKKKEKGEIALQDYERLKKILH